MSELKKAAKAAFEAMGLIGADLVCEASHHEKKDRHEIGEPCPIQARWNAAYAALAAALAESQRKPLTEEQIDELVRQNFGYITAWQGPFVRAIEKAHGITGGSE